jgi:hypothetical protein
MWKIVFDGYEEPELYDTYEEAEEAAEVMCDNYHQGAVDLYLSNPGDFEEEGGNADDPPYEIIEV